MIALHQKLRELGYFTLRPESPWSKISADAVAILQENLGEAVTGEVGSKEEYDEIMRIDNSIVVGKNLAVGTSDSWSEWMSPEVDAQNRCFNPYQAVLPADKKVGDYFTCSLEIEFKDVSVPSDQQFRFWTQGAVDGTWNIGNIWRGNIINLYAVPEDGVYEYKVTSRIDDRNVGSLNFNLGFRCDYWKSGSFRVRNVKAEKGSRATE